MGFDNENPLFQSREKAPLRRTPRGYDGIKPTGRSLSNLLPRVLKKIHEKHKSGGHLVLAMWPEVIGNSLSPMTRAYAFKDDVLFVKVSNSSLLSLLKGSMKNKVLSSLRSKAEGIPIRDVVYRLG